MSTERELVEDKTRRVGTITFTVVYDIIDPLWVDTYEKDKTAYRFEVSEQLRNDVLAGAAKNIGSDRGSGILGVRVASCVIEVDEETPEETED